VSRDNTAPDGTFGPSAAGTYDICITPRPPPAGALEDQRRLDSGPTDQSRRHRARPVDRPVDLVDHAVHGPRLRGHGGLDPRLELPVRGDGHPGGDQPSQSESLSAPAGSTRLPRRSDRARPLPRRPRGVQWGAASATAARSLHLHATATPIDLTLTRSVPSGVLAWPSDRAGLLHDLQEHIAVLFGQAQVLASTTATTFTDVGADTDGTTTSNRVE